MKIHKITELTYTQAAQLIGRHHCAYDATGEIAHTGTISGVLPDDSDGTVRLDCACGKWWIAGGDYITVTGDLPWETTVSTTTVSKITKGITNAEACALLGLHASFVDGDGETYATGEITSAYTDDEGDTRAAMIGGTIYLFRHTTSADGHILIDGPLPWEASDAPESDAAPEACETPRERVERLTRDLSDAQDALAREGLPEGWHHQLSGIVHDNNGASVTHSNDREGYTLVVDDEGDVSRVEFAAIAAFVDIVREQRAENA